MDKNIYKLIFYLLFFFSFESYGQLMFNDGFENGSFGEWSNTEQWVISEQTSLVGVYSLRHNLTGVRSSSFITRKIPATGFNNGAIIWTFKLKNGKWVFAATEQVCFYLLSDKPDLTTANGYAIGINLNGGDNVLKLCKMENGKAVQDILLTDFVWKAETAVELEVVHQFGLWSVKYKEGTANSWSAPKTGNEKAMNFSFGNIGLFFKYNTSHGGQIWADDISMSYQNSPPAVYDVRSTGRDKVLILFSEAMLPIPLLTANNYAITTASGLPVGIKAVWKASGDSAGVYLRLENFSSYDLHLTMHNLTDVDGAPLSGNDVSFTFVPTAQFGDIVFNEVMADPTPVVQLPNKEYIELISVCNFTINLKNWALEVNGKQKLLTDFDLLPEKFLIVSGTGGKAIWDNFGANMEVTGLSLPNAGATLKLYSPAQTLIDSFTYKPSMHREGFSNGGYSLERIDPIKNCGVYANWETSTSDKGGTPGTENSVYSVNHDNTPPTVTSVSVISPSLLEISISEKPDIQININSIFSYTPTLPVPDSIKFDAGQLKYSIYFPNGPIENGVVYDLLISGLTDVCGNRSPDVHRGFWYFIPKAGDLLINEVLFDPFAGGVDFVEIYNSSGKKVDLSEIYLASRDNDLKFKSIYPLATVSEMLLDGSYAAFTSDSVVLLANYSSTCPECIYKMAKFPAYNVDEGWVVLLNKQMGIIDEFHYLESMHHPMIGDVKGISLERTSFSRPSNDPTNWHSASKTVGFATPGYKNSSAGVPLDKPSGIVTFGTEFFSPNGDGTNDKFQIKLSPGGPDWLANIRIFNEDGIEIKRLANNLTIGENDIIEWDGTTENHQIAGLGVYIVKVELFSLNSGRKQYKSVCVLTDRLE